MKPTVTISISVYNDSESVKNLISDYHQAGIKGENIYYLLIDDGSTDNSAETIKNLSSEFPNTSYILHEKNYGFGITIQEAVTYPKTNYILYISGDHQFHSDAAIRLLDCISQAPDYVLGIRDKRKDSIYRKLLSISYNKLISTLTSIKVKDINSVFLIKRESVKKIELKSRSAFIHAEIFLKLKKAGLNCKNIVIPHHPRQFGKGSGGKISIIILTLKDLIKFMVKS